MTSNERDLLKERAELMNLEFKPNISTDKLRALVNGTIDGTSTDVVKDEENDEVVESAAVDSKAKKAPGKAIKLTEDEIVSQRTGELRKEMMGLHRVIISCNDPQMKEHETTPPLSVSNSIITLPKIVVPLNVEWHIPKAYYDMMKDQTCGIAVKSKDLKGRPITVRKEIKKYNIQDLPPLDKEELIALKNAQAARDGVAKA